MIIIAANYYNFLNFCLAKNVAVDIAGKLCNSVAAKLEGKVLGTFTGIILQALKNTSILCFNFYEALTHKISVYRCINTISMILNKNIISLEFCWNFLVTVLFIVHTL